MDGSVAIFIGTKAPTFNQSCSAVQEFAIDWPWMLPMSPEKPYRVDAARLQNLVDEVMSADNPDGRLHDIIVPLAHSQQLEMQAALFESIVARRPVRQFWVLYTMARCYDLMGRRDACFFVACQALELERQHLHSWLLYRDVFSFLNAHGCYQAAVEIFREEINRWPDSPIAPQWEIADIAKKADMVLDDSLVNHDETTHRSLQNANVVNVFRPELRPRWTCPVYGPHAPEAITALDRDLERRAIDAIVLRDTEIILYNNRVVVIDQAGRTIPELSVCEYPDFVRRRAEEILADGGGEEVRTDVAVVIADHFIVPNLCHFLFDHLSRLEIYRRAGVVVENALVIGGVIETEFQQAALDKLGIHRYLDVKRIARVRAREIWGSSNCRHLQHPGHLGAAWTIEFLRRSFSVGNPDRNEKIYISRSDARTRRVRNEEEVMAELEKSGFRMIVPGQMPFAEQVSTLAAASHVIGAHGAGLTNAVFSRPGTSVLEIFPPLYSTYGYAAIAQEAGWRYAALTARDWESEAPEVNDPNVADMSTGRFGNRDIWVDLNLLRQWLKDYL